MSLPTIREYPPFAEEQAKLQALQQEQGRLRQELNELSQLDYQAEQVKVVGGKS